MVKKRVKKSIKQIKAATNAFSAVGAILAREPKFFQVGKIVSEQAQKLETQLKLSYTNCICA